MNRRFLLVCIVTFLLAWPLTVAAQGGPRTKSFLGKWWKMPEFTGEISLTREERDSLDALYLDSHAKLIDARAAKTKAKLILDDLLEKDELDEKAIYGQVDEVNKAMAVVNTERFRFLIEVRKLLGVKRHAQLKSLFGKHRRRFLKERINQAAQPPAGD
jgi:hypothetical protein